MLIYAIHAHDGIPIYTCNICTYAIYVQSDIPSTHAYTCNTCTWWHTYIYMLYMHIHAIPIHTDTYMPYRLIPAIHAHACMHCVHIHVHTCNTRATLIVACMHIHPHTCTYMHIHNPTPQTWNGHISTTTYPIETSQRTDLIAVSGRQIVLVCGIFH